ncbi:MAG: glycosyltransferase [Bacteroidia bacterium]|nr:glycosyltransferase [Bacteroidia bacterium]
MNKNIVIIGPAHPLRGGIAAFSERLANGFLDNGDNVRIETFSLQYPNFLFPGETQYSTSPPPENLNITVSINSINPLNWYKIGGKIKKEKPDIAVVAYWMPFISPCLGTIIRIIRKNRHTRIIALVHNLIPHEKIPGTRLLTKYFIKKVDAFAAMSKTVLDDIESFDKVKPKIYSPHPLYDNYGPVFSREEALNRLGLDKNFNYILFFGIIREYKGLDLLLEGFADARLRKYNLKLIIAGEFYSKPEPYFEIIRRNNLHNHLFIKQEFIPDNEVANYFNAADIIVQPYKNATQSGVAQIGFHFNKPVLVTNVGGLGEIIPHKKAGYVVEKSPAAIADALVDFYENKRKEEFSQNVILEKTKYSWDKFVGVIYKL